MNIDPVSVVNAIKAVAPATVSLGMQQAQRNEYIIKVLKSLNLDPIQPPKDFEGVYAYTLVEYGVFKADYILKFFRKKEIKKAFAKSFVENALAINNEEWNTLKDEAQKAKIDLAQFQEFHEVFVSLAKRSRNPGEVISNVQFPEHLKTFTEPPKQSLYPDEFKALIEEKTKAFCGRVFVFNEFDDFLKKHPKGYFTVIGDAGMGKSAIAAQSVLKYKAICYFNLQAQGLNTPEQFLQSICQQLINRYQLQNAENDNLPTLLMKVNEKLAASERLVIVVDALDEVKQPGSENLLYLPKNLPERIYFLLTRRRYAQNEKRLLTEEVEWLLDLTKKKYEVWNRKDVKEYISAFINDEPEHQGLKACMDSKTQD
ncbi:AAA family ATPase [Nostoc sp.]|uniref:AAA family ATPase n=1 Tax=Nostoc sp. TaxID=1180 RepID=UPI002FFC758B